MGGTQSSVHNLEYEKCICKPGGIHFALTAVAVNRDQCYFLPTTLRCGFYVLNICRCSALYIQWTRYCYKVPGECDTSCSFWRGCSHIGTNLFLARLVIIPINSYSSQQPIVWPSPCKASAQKDISKNENDLNDEDGEDKWFAATCHTHPIRGNCHSRGDPLWASLRLPCCSHCIVICWFIIQRCVRLLPLWDISLLIIFTGA